MKTPPGDEYDPQMVEICAATALYILKRYEGMLTGVFHCETKVSLEFIEPGMFGTVDAAVAEIFGRLVVIDFKYGAGVAVEPKDNTQMIYYALGIAHEYDYNFTRSRNFRYRAAARVS